MAADPPNTASTTETRVLLMAPTRRDAEITRSLLERAALSCVICPDLDTLRGEIAAGAGAILATEETVAHRGIEDVLATLERQPPWSDLPVVLLVRGGGEAPTATRAIRSLRNVTLLERPAPTRSVVSAVQAAVRSRLRQYQIRDQIEAISHAQARSRQLQEELALAIDSSELGTFHCDLPSGKILWNDRCKSQFWLPPDAEVDFDRFYSILHPDDREATRAAVNACVLEGRAYDVTYRTVSPTTGEHRWLRATGRAYRDANGEPSRFDGTTQDVTEERERARERERLLEAERAARAETERTGRMKDEFLATLSHELRTPLNAILGWSTILRGGSPGGEALTEDVAEGLAIIERNARAQNQIIEDLLDMSRIISGKVRLDVQRLNLATVIAAAVETLRPAADAKGIRLQVVLDPQAGPVSGDPDRLQQVFWNLLGNAVKFTPKGGRVQVILERINSHLEVSVNDTGQGIAAEFLPHVFERFRQADGSTARAHGGLGLGLAIVKQLVDLHGGTVRVRSGGLGQGTTFTVALPLTVLRPDPDDAAAAVAGGERRHPRAGGTPAPGLLPANGLSLAGVKVLVVDDEPDARALVRRLLEDRRATVHTAASAAAAMERIAADRPDVLVSDIGMPEEDGYSLIRRVRALKAEQGGAVPALALTAYARAEDRMKAVLAGFQMHVAKPVEPAELLTMVASLAGRTGRV